MAPSGSILTKLVLEAGPDYGSLGASLVVQPEESSVLDYTPPFVDEELLEWLQESQSLSCLMVYISDPITSSSTPEPLNPSPIDTRANKHSSLEDVANKGEVESIGIGKPITNRHRGKRRHSLSTDTLPTTPSPADGLHTSRSHSRRPNLSPSAEELPIDELPPGWLQERVGEFQIHKHPAHDTTTLETAAFGKEDFHLSSCQDPVQEGNLGTTEQPQPILLASWLWQHPILLDQVIAFMHSYSDIFARSYSDLQGIPPELGIHTIPLTDDTRPVRERAF